MISYLHLCCVCIAHRYSKCAILTWLNPYSWKSDCRLWVSSGPHISSFNNILSEYQAFSLNLLVSLVQCCSFSCNEVVLNPSLPPRSLFLSSLSPADGAAAWCRRHQGQEALQCHVCRQGHLWPHEGLVVRHSRCKPCVWEVGWNDFKDLQQTHFFFLSPNSIKHKTFNAKQLTLLKCLYFEKRCLGTEHHDSSLFSGRIHEHAKRFVWLSQTNEFELAVLLSGKIIS